jgi:hypothetical protein
MKSSAEMDLFVWFEAGDDVEVLRKIIHDTLANTQARHPTVRLRRRVVYAPRGGLPNRIRFLPPGRAIERWTDVDLSQALGQGPFAKDLQVFAETCMIGATLPDEDALFRWLAAELSSDQYTRLSALGTDPKDRGALAQVFMDLPLDRSQSTFGQTLCNALRRHSPPRNRFSAQIGDGAFHLLVGGPGQGKTTLGAWLCQLLRAQLLLSQPARGAEDTKRLAVETLATWPAPRLPWRLPFRVVLHRFADRLARRIVGSLEEELYHVACEQLRGPDRDGSEVSRADFETAWTRCRPRPTDRRWCGQSGATSTHTALRTWWCWPPPDPRATAGNSTPPSGPSTG